MYRNVDIRYALPRDERYVTPVHQDHFFIRQTPRFRTLWIPIMDIGEAVGGLALASGSHELGLLQPVDEGRSSAALKWEDYEISGRRDVYDVHGVQRMDRSFWSSPLWTVESPERFEAVIPRTRRLVGRERRDARGIAHRLAVVRLPEAGTATS
ncbi:MAG: phytanoyl-CoA dioxygenase family protein [Vicinamibacteraceae bacterium]